MLYRPPLPEGVIVPAGTNETGPSARRAGFRFHLIGLSLGLGAAALALAFGAAHCPARTKSSCYVSSRADRSERPDRAERVAARAQLLAEREAAAERLGRYEQAVDRGEACRAGIVRLRIEVLRLDEQLAHCPRQRAFLHEQRTQLEAQRRGAMLHADRGSFVH